MITSKPVRDNRPLEARADVLTFTTAPLDQVLEAVGPVRVQLWIRGSEPYFDLFARVCDVDPAGASWNVCDALASVAPGRFEQSDMDSSWRVHFDLWPIAASRPVTVSVCKSPPARIHAMCETPEQERTRSQQTSRGPSKWSSSMALSGPPRCFCLPPLPVAPAKPGSSPDNRAIANERSRLTRAAMCAASASIERH